MTIRNINTFGILLTIDVSCRLCMPYM